MSNEAGVKLLISNSTQPFKECCILIIRKIIGMEGLAKEKKQIKTTQVIGNLIYNGLFHLQTKNINET